MARCPSKYGTPAGMATASGLPPGFDLDEFFAWVNRDPVMANMRVVYFDGLHVLELRPGLPLCAPGLRTIVIHRIPPGGAPEVTATRSSRLFQELLGASLSCTGAALSMVVMIGGGAAIPFTGGGSSFLAVMGWGAAAASGVRCVNGAVRVWSESWGAGTLNDTLDERAWYRATTLALDGVSLVGAGLSIQATRQLAGVLRAGTNTKPSILKALAGLSRQDRKRLAEYLIKLRNPGISGRRVKALVRLGAYPKRFRQVDVSATMRNQLKDAAAAALGFTGSATGGLVRRTGDYVVGVAEGFHAY